MTEKIVKLVTTKSRMSEILDKDIDEVIMCYKNEDGEFYCNWTSGWEEQELSYATDFLKHEVCRTNFGDSE